MRATLMYGSRKANASTLPCQLGEASPDGPGVFVGSWVVPPTNPRRRGWGLFGSVTAPRRIEMTAPQAVRLPDGTVQVHGATTQFAVSPYPVLIQDPAGSIRRSAGGALVLWVWLLTWALVVAAIAGFGVVVLLGIGKSPPPIGLRLVIGCGLVALAALLTRVPFNLALQPRYERRLLAEGDARAWQRVYDRDGDPVFPRLVT